MSHAIHRRQTNIIHSQHTNVSTTKMKTCALETMVTSINKCHRSIIDRDEPLANIRFLLASFRLDENIVRVQC
jgi:hypothetical protein